MCLAIPAKIITVDKTHALAETMGVIKKINTQLIDSPSSGDYILVHAGFAIEKIDPDYFNFLNEKLSEMIEDIEDDM